MVSAETAEPTLIVEQERTEVPRLPPKEPPRTRMLNQSAETAFALMTATPVTHPTDGAPAPPAHGVQTSPTVMLTVPASDALDLPTVDLESMEVRLLLLKANLSALLMVSASLHLDVKGMLAALELALVARPMVVIIVKRPTIVLTALSSVASVPIPSLPTAELLLMLMVVKPPINLIVNKPQPAVSVSMLAPKEQPMLTALEPKVRIVWPTVSVLPVSAMMIADSPLSHGVEIWEVLLSVTMVSAALLAKTLPALPPLTA